MLAVLVIGLRFWDIVGDRPETMGQVADGLTSILIAAIVGLMITYGRDAAERAEAKRAENEAKD